MVRLGDTGIIDLRIGDTGAKRAYLGDVQVWPGYHRLKFWTDEHPIADMDSWMDGAIASGLYCVSEDVSDFWASLRDYPDMTSVYDATGDRTFPVIAVNGGADVSVLASRDGAVGMCYVNTDITSAQVVYEGEGSQRQAVGYAYIGAFVWSDDGTTREVAWCWIVDTDVEIQESATFTYGSETHTVSKGGVYLPRATVGFSGSGNEFVTREYGVEEYTPIPAETTTLRLHLTSELTQNLYYTQSAANGVTIDWGDGSTAETVSDLSATATHTYAAAGDYTVSMTAGSGVTWGPGCTINDGQTDVQYGVLGQYNKHAVHPQMTLFVFGSGCGLNIDAFNGCTGLTSIVLPEWITQIPECAFQGCTGITSIDIPASVTQIGREAFDGCSLTTVCIPSTVSFVSAGAFGCGAYLQTVEVGATELDSGVFWDDAGVGGMPDAMTSIWIRETCTTLPGGATILHSAFSACDNATIYAEPTQKPSGWHEDFNLVDTKKDSSGTFQPLYLPVVYGQTTQPW